jgi:GAF domain-containing protein
MPLNWHTPSSDEQFFQSVLAAAFTIQEHNERQKLVPQALARQTQAEPEARLEPGADRLCSHCGAVMSADISRCGSCGVEETDSIERMPSNWASKWLMSQEQSMWPLHPPEAHEGPRTSVPPRDVERKPQDQAPRDSARPTFLVPPVAKAAKETIRQEETEIIHDRALDTSACDQDEAKSQWSTEATRDLIPEELAAEESKRTAQPLQLTVSDSAGANAPTGARLDVHGSSTELKTSCVPNHLLQEMVQQAIQATHATGAAIALAQRGSLICGAAAGDFASEIGKMINTRSGFTGVCASTGTMQLCSNTALDSGVDAGVCRKLGVSAIIVVPLRHQDRLLGLVAVFSRRPYAFGMRTLEVLQDLAERFAAMLQLSGESEDANHG